MAEARYDQDVRRDKDLLPYVYAALPEREFGDVQFDGEMLFGNGEDGDVTISADTSLSEDMYYSNLTIDSGKTLNPNGWRVFVKNTLTLNGDLGVKESVASVSAGSLSGTVGVGQSVVDGLGGAGEPDGYEPGFTFTGSGSVTSSLGIDSSDFYDLRAAVNAYQRRGGDFLRVKGGAGGGTGADGVGGAGAAGNWPPNANTVGAPGGKGSAGTGGTGGAGARGGGVVMLAARVITGEGGIYSEGGAGVAGTAGSGGTPAPSYTDPASTVHSEGPPVTGQTPPTGGTHFVPGPPVSEHGPGAPVVTGHSEAPDIITGHSSEHGPGPDVVTETEAVHGPGPDGAAHHHHFTGPTHHNSTYNFHLPGTGHASTFVGFPGPDIITGYSSEHGPGPDVVTETEAQHGDGGETAQHGPGPDVVTETEAGAPVQVDYFEAGEYFSYEGPDVQTHEAATVHPGGGGGTGYTGQRGGRGGGGVLIVVTRDAGTPTYTFNTGVNGRLIALDTANI